MLDSESPSPTTLQADTRNNRINLSTGMCSCQTVMICARSHHITTCSPAWLLPWHTYHSRYTSTDKP